MLQYSTTPIPQYSTTPCTTPAITRRSLPSTIRSSPALRFRPSPGSSPAFFVVNSISSPPRSHGRLTYKKSPPASARYDGHDRSLGPRPPDSTMDQNELLCLRLIDSDPPHRLSG